MSRTYLLLLLAVMILPFGCRNKAPQPATKTIGVSLLTRAHQFYRDLEEGLQKTAQKYHYRLIVNAAEFDPNRQIAQLEDFVTRGVDAIIVCPVDSRGVGKGIQAANEKNIPVFTADIASFAGQVVSHIASDNVAGGRLAGEYLAKLLQGKGKVAIINQPVVTSTLDRVKGFRQAIQNYPGIQIVADVNGQGVRDKAMQAAADILQAHPDLDGVFAINDDSALGALDAVEDFQRQGIAIVGYDATPEAREAILKGSALKADVVQYPKIIGEMTIESIAKYFAHEEVPAVIPVKVGMVDQKALISNFQQQ